MSGDDRSLARLPSGFRDLSPGEAAAQRWMVETVCRVYESFGFVPLDTSAVEYYSTLVCGHQEGGEKQIYRLYKEDLPPPDKALALRFELTSSLARYLAMHAEEISMPFKRYQSGYVWRGERPQRGRFRQFLQFDVDTVGIADPVADAEIVEVIYRSLRALGVPRFTVKVSSRHLLSGLALSLGIEGSAELEMFRILDKHDKVGTQGLLSLLQEPPARGGMGLGPSAVDRVAQLVALEGNPWHVLEEAQRLIGDNEQVRRGVRELSSILDYLAAAQVPSEFVRVVPTLARGLDYYTGPVFETFVEGHESIGSVMSGGRYDGLIGRFLGRMVPATGVSMGVDRLLVVLASLGLAPQASSPCQALVSVLSPGERRLMYGLAARLRAEGIPVELYMGEDCSFRAQISHAARRGIRYLVIQGDQERDRGVVALRDLQARTQEELTLEDAVRRLSSGTPGPAGTSPEPPPGPGR